jgi:hypothetical protein
VCLKVMVLDENSDCFLSFLVFLGIKQLADDSNFVCWTDFGIDSASD